MQKIYRIYPLLLILCSFSPYAVKSLGIKAEHMVIIPVFLMSIAITLLNRVKLNRELIPLLYLWMSFLIFTIMRTVFSYQSTLMSSIAEFGNFLMPMLILLFYFFNFNKLGEPDSDLISKVIRLLNSLLIANSVLIIISILGVDITAILQFYWKGFVAENSLGNGRFTGIFNQPMESGMSYSIGVLGWLYLVEKQSKVKMKNLISILLLIVGGIASVSKVFLLGGFLLFLLGALRNKGVRKSLLKMVFLFTPIVYIAYLILKDKWVGMSYLMRFFTIQDGQFINTITSGRFGGENTMKNQFGEIWQQHPLVGLGFGQNSVADSQWFQVFGAAGLIGFMIFLLFTIILLYKVWEFKLRIGNTGEYKLFSALVLLCVLASIGAPIYTLNRSSIVLWVLIGLLLVHKNRQQVEREKVKINKLNLLREKGGSVCTGTQSVV